jgi:hypothetical protein
MNTIISLSYLLHVHEINTDTLRDLAVQGIESERINLQAYEATYNAVGYCASLRKITQYYKILSVLRGDTLNALSGWGKSVN